MPNRLIRTVMVLGAAAMLSAALPVASQAADGIANKAASDPWAGTKWLIRGRVIGMIPDENDGKLGGASADLKVDDAVMPELDFSYFVTDYLALELILAATRHDVTLGGTGKITTLWVLPPTLTLQYHHKMGPWKPYAGVGINYTTILSSDATSAIGNSDKWNDEWGFALQAGLDYAINDRWSVNFDIKKIWLNLDARVGAARTPASVDLDPWVIGAGIGYRF